jgi:hypothetical protein
MTRRTVLSWAVASLTVGILTADVSAPAYADEVRQGLNRRARVPSTR